MATVNQNIDLNNPEFQHVWELIQNTHRSVFMTGKAGTGKSTFLRYICRNTKKKYVVLAPTGVAAVNVGGQTLHSFFKIPFKPLLPDDPDFSQRQIRKTLRYSGKTIKLIRKLELIIIDEISMVRADIIDFIDHVLRIFSGNMREPFGGKQLLFVGDVFQLEPVVTRDAKEILQRYYKQFFFFNARVFSSLGLIPIELRKTYRQNDSAFISLLDRVRDSHANARDIAMLNTRYNPNYVYDGDFVITLATRRDTVDSINDERLQALKSPEFTFEGEISGTFNDADLPTSKELTLKKGAQVIFIRNDKDGRWVNGTIGIIDEIDKDGISVKLEDGNTYVLEKEIWENMQYSYDEKEKKVIETILGTFIQYPIKAAWALTVHKSQGLTFSKVVVDFTGGAFTSGQTYVALSRCTSLEGITLLKPLSERDIIVSMAVMNFSRQFNNEAMIGEALRQEQAAALYRTANVAFENGHYRDCIDQLFKAMAISNQLNTPAAKRLLAKKLRKITTLKNEVAQLQEVVDSQYNMLRKLAREYTAMGDQALGYGTLVNEDTVGYGKKKRRASIDDIALKSAIANYDKAISIVPDCVEAWIGKGRLFALIDQLDEAESLLKKAIEISPNSFDAHMALGDLYITMHDTPAAIKSFKRAIKADKTRFEPHDKLSTLYSKIGLTDLAADHEDMARQLRQAAAAPKPHRRKK